MHKLQELVRLYRLGTGVRERSRLLRMSTTTERAYRRAIAAAELLEGDPNDLPELSAIRAAIAVAIPPAAPRSFESSVDDWMPQIQSAADKGAGAQAIWDQLRRTKPDFSGSLSAVKRAVHRLQRAKPVQPEDVVIRVETEPGAIAQVDFGFAGRFFDPKSGQIRRAWVFVMVLGYSRHMFAKLVWDQRATTWVQLHVAAFEWFGGVPATLVPDNLKAAVVRSAFGVADRDNLALNRTYRELARHYGFKVDPTPPRQPEKKGKVESAVKYVKRNFLAAAEIETLADGNAQLADWVTRIAGERVHGTTGRRPIEVFALEKPALRPLPVEPYEAVFWKPATIHPDTHVEFDRRLYSAPWKHVGQKAWIRATDASVYVYVNDERVATHVRKYSGRASTNEAHLPEHRREFANRSEDYWQSRADLLGDNVGQYVAAVLNSDDVLSRLRDAQAIVRYLEPFPRHRAQRAARRAHVYGNYSFQSLKRILTTGLDLEPLDDDAERHGELPMPRFARNHDAFAPGDLT